MRRRATLLLEAAVGRPRQRKTFIEARRDEIRGARAPWRYFATTFCAPLNGTRSPLSLIMPIEYQ